MRKILTILMTIMMCLSSLPGIKAEDTNFEIINDTINYKAGAEAEMIEVKININTDCIKSVYLNNEILDRSLYYIDEGVFYLNQPNQCKDRVFSNIISRENILTFEYLENEEVKSESFTFYVDNYDYNPTLQITYGTDPFENEIIDNELKDINLLLDTSLDGLYFELGRKIEDNDDINEVLLLNTNDDELYSNLIYNSENGSITIPKEYLETLENGEYYYYGAWFGYKFIRHFVLDRRITETDLNDQAVTETETDLLSGAAYAVLTSDGDLIFFRSNESYTDGRTETVTDINGKEYTGVVYANVENISTSDEEEIPWYDSKENIERVYVSENNTIQPISFGYWFYDCENLEEFNSVGFDTSNITDMQDMFSGCSSLTTLDVSNFDTSNVEYMWDMFSDCSSLTSLDLSSFNTVNVTDMTYMFYGCESLTNLNLSNFNTSNVEYMQDMFENCSSLTSLNLGSFNTGSVTNMNNTFTGCSSLTSLDLSNFNTGNVTDMSYMFYGCSSLTTLDISNFDTNSATDMSSMFYGCGSLAEIKLGSGFTVWSDEAYLPEGSWTNGSVVKTEMELYGEYPANAEEWAGLWYKIIKYVESISLNKNTIGLNIGNAETLTATVLPDNATLKTLNWTSSDDSVATVDQNGTVSAVSEGTAVITATTADGTNLSAQCTVTVLKGEEPIVIKGSSLVLEGVIQVQFRVIVPDIEDKNVVIKFTGGNANNSYEESSDATERRYKIKETEAGTECYYRVPVYAKQMNDKVNIWFTDKEGNRVSFYTGSGVDVTETGYEYSVAKYINNKWNDEDEKLRELVRAMKYYGLYAMKNFKYEVELADSILAELEPMADVDISLLEEYAYNKEGVAPEGLSAASFSLTLEEDIRINYKLNVGEGVNFKDYSIKLDGKKATPVQNDSGDWYVYKANIKAKDMDTMHELTISKGEDSIVYRYGVLSYCYSKLSNSGTSTKLKNLCKAIYWYSKAADAYWGQ